jgi:hypothetical protein
VVVFALPARPSMEASHSGVVRISCAHLDLIGGQSSVCCPLANLFGSRDGRFWPHPACIRLRLSRSRATISGVVKVPLGEEMEASRAISARRCPKRCSRDAACPDRSLRSHAGGPSLRARGVNHRLALGAVGHGEAKSLLNTCPAGTRTAWVRGWRSKRIPYSCARERYSSRSSPSSYGSFESRLWCAMFCAAAAPLSPVCASACSMSCLRRENAIRGCRLRVPSVRRRQ